MTFLIIFVYKNKKMINITYIRKNPDIVKEKLKLKNFKELNLIDEIFELDKEKRLLQSDLDTKQNIINNTSLEIGKLKSKNINVDSKIELVKNLKIENSFLIERLELLDSLIYNHLVKIPNIPNDNVPKGNSTEDNEVIKESLLTENLLCLDHIEIIKKYNLGDFEIGSKITGSGFPIFKGNGSKLQRALISYFLDFNIERGYIEYSPPYLVNQDSAFGTGQYPDKENQMYLTQDNLYLIPTSEVPITNIYRDTLLKEEDLPIKMTAFSPCFRREAGGYGKDTKGLNRVHQFDKVEIVQIVHPDKSYDVLDEMVNHVEGLIKSLELPYRIIRLCGGDMSFTSAITYDFEVYSFSQKRWLEVSSVSNFESFQTNRLKCRFKDSDKKITLTHSLNGSSLAIPRIMVCLLENNQVEDGIILPKVLQPYYGNDKIVLI